RDRADTNTIHLHLASNLGRHCFIDVRLLRERLFQRARLLVVLHLSAGPRISGLAQRITVSMDLQLSDKTALVTGSTAGIGYAIAERLAREGASVIVNGRTSERVDNAIAAIRTIAPAARVLGFAGDLGTADAAREAIRRFPQVDILVNNLGIF